MGSPKVQSENQHPSATINPAMTSCRKKKSEDATFLQDLRDHVDEFIHASMDEHKTCFKKTIQKMFGMSKVVAERTAEAKEVESFLPLQTTVTKVVAERTAEAKEVESFLPLQTTVSDNRVEIRIWKLCRNKNLEAVDV